MRILFGTCELSGVFCCCFLFVCFCLSEMLVMYDGYTPILCLVNWPKILRLKEEKKCGVPCTPPPPPRSSAFSGLARLARLAADRKKKKKTVCPPPPPPYGLVWSGMILWDQPIMNNHIEDNTQKIVQICVSKPICLPFLDQIDSWLPW